MSLEPTPEPQKKEKRKPTLAGEIRKTRRDYLKSVLLKKRAIGIPLTPNEQGQLAAFESMDDE